jgi:hypothetical protein
MVKYKLVDAQTGGRNRLSFTVQSNFGGRDVLQLTMVLNDLTNGNSFYDKHVLRRGEDANDILETRNAARNASLDPERINLAKGMGIVLTDGGVPASTIVDLGRIDHQRMLFDFAQALATTYRNGTFQQTGRNFDVEVTFSAHDCVYTLRRNGGGYHSDGIKVGAQLVADGGDELTFAINHCVGDL